jgi:hypothetical protein
LKQNLVYPVILSGSFSHFSLQTWIDIAGSTTLGRITGDVPKITFFFALGAYVRWCNSRDEKAALTTFPEGLTALRADISCELTVGSVTTAGTYMFLLFVFHSFFLLFLMLG